ncbi:MAG: hypothetical protein LBM25_00755 [Bacteroidales bacterium]|jgi:hypothetical protein|nr:hypothetical protein [Bacteroidales bacterium]
MKKLLLFYLLIFCCNIFTHAQVEIIFDTLKINKLVYFHSGKKYRITNKEKDTITLGTQFFMEWNKPSAKSTITFKNHSDSTILLTRDNFYYSFNIDNINYAIPYIEYGIKIYDTILIAPDDSIKIDFTAYDLLLSTRELNTNNKVKLSPISNEYYYDYSNIIYSILPSFHIVYKENDLIVHSNVPNVIILNRYNKGNLKDYQKSMKSEELTEEEWDFQRENDNDSAMLVYVNKFIEENANKYSFISIEQCDTKNRKFHPEDFLMSSDFNGDNLFDFVIILNNKINNNIELLCFLNKKTYFECYYMDTYPYNNRIDFSFWLENKMDNFEDDLRVSSFNWDFNFLYHWNGTNFVKSNYE